MRYGYSSIFDENNANFWINENFICYRKHNIYNFLFQLLMTKFSKKYKTLGIATALLILDFWITLELMAVPVLLNEMNKI